MHDGDVAGRSVLVTGAAGGLGRAFARAFAKAGAAVAVADIDIAGAEQTAGLIRDKGGQAIAHAVDVTSAGSIERSDRVRRRRVRRCRRARE